MAVTVELQAEWTPGRHPQRAKSQILVNEVDGIVQAFAVVRFQIRLVGLLVMPGLVAAARLHRPQNADYAGLFAALHQDFLDPIFLPETLPAAHELNLDGVVGRDTFHVLAQRLAQRLGPLGIVEDPDAVGVKIACDPAGVAPTRHRPLDNDPVVARQNPGDLILIPLR